ncbi:MULTISPECIES: GntR family transcriptional regulator [Bacillus]|uniref:GntR family transcriptional regulator n=2 Tax=Bacillus TaxID=1386 RepID=A0A0M4FU67_9BACI|nr:MULTISPECIES: GntR family transcriptional regulator [Bacillus]ALC83723.1 GntR family transcriptional regulator [Bacillus gobiensis]MBP1083932.1 DNA-binding transcriptional regulator YhcF (GntR family) [Bacillus capparidis]MED1097019.1 GntR family transcriptional regulator [Bacillus capparidis]
MKPTLDESQPIFYQIAEMIMEDIVSGRLQEGEKVPSTNELSRFYNINPATARKGLQALVDNEVIFKQRGVGMFVKEGAKLKLLQERRQDFFEQYVKPMLEEAERLKMSKENVIDLINGRTGETND